MAEADRPPTAPPARDGLATISLDRALHPVRSPHRVWLGRSVVALAALALLLTLFLTRPAAPAAPPVYHASGAPAAQASPQPTINPIDLALLTNVAHYTITLNGQPATLIHAGVTAPYLRLVHGANAITITAPSAAPLICVQSAPPAPTDSCPLAAFLAAQPHHTAIRVLLFWRGPAPPAP